MKKTLGLVTLTASLVAAGCAVMPHAVKSVSGWSGPVTLNIVGAPVQQTSGRSTQAIRTGALQAVVKIFKPSATAVYAGFKAISAIETDPVTGNALYATASITTSASSITLPKIPAGNHIVQLLLYSTKNKVINTDGTVVGGSEFYLLGEAEAAVAPVVGVPLTATLPVYSTFDKVGSIQVVSLTGATASLSFTGLAAPTGGLYLRMPTWNATGSLPDSSASLRLSIVSNTAYSTTLASTSNAAGWFTVGDIDATAGISATNSFMDPTYAGAGTWNWTSDRKCIYTNVDVAAATDSLENYGGVGVGAVSFYLPAALLPSGYTLYLTSNASGSSLAGAGSL